jgi:hypothetical protein
MEIESLEQIIAALLHGVLHAMVELFAPSARSASNGHTIKLDR